MKTFSILVKYNMKGIFVKYYEPSFMYVAVWKWCKYAIRNSFVLSGLWLQVPGPGLGHAAELSTFH